MTDAPATTAATTTPADRVRRDWYLTRLSWAMQDYPGRRLKAITRDLRAELDAAAADVGMRRALADLGHPRVLAARYEAELPRPLPRYATGALAAGLVVSALAYLFLAYSAGTLDALEALGGGTLTRYPFGAETVFTSADGGLSVESSWSAQGVLVVTGAALVAFLLGSRLWRLLA